MVGSLCDIKGDRGVRQLGRHTCACAQPDAMLDAGMSPCLSAAVVIAMSSTSLRRKVSTPYAHRRAPGTLGSVRPDLEGRDEPKWNHDRQRMEMRRPLIDRDNEFYL